MWTAQLSDKRRYSNRDSQAVKAWVLSACPTDGIRIRNLFQRAAELRAMMKPIDHPVPPPGSSFAVMSGIAQDQHNAIHRAS